MNEKNRLISEILSMDFTSERIEYALKILNEEIKSLEKKLDVLEQKESLTSEEKEEQKKLLEIGKVCDKEKDLLLTMQNLMILKQELTKDKKTKN